MNAGRQTVDVVIPVHDEERALAPSVELLLDYLRREFPFRFRVVIADAASSDGTPLVAERLAAGHSEVSLLRLDEAGRGRALKAVWLASSADVVAYMGVDVSTSLESFLPLVAPILSGHSELAIGTRAARRRAYEGLVHLLFHARFSDARCGFKAVRADVARRLLPLVVDDGSFFDTELLLLAERNGLRIHEVPVDWAADRRLCGDLAGLLRLRREFWRGGGRIPIADAAAAAT